jgi:hypothetical protein
MWNPISRPLVLLVLMTFSPLLFAQTDEAPGPAISEIHQLYIADQEDRRAEKIDWSKVGPRDSERRNRAHELLAEGKLTAARDFHDAAFIFQHGEKPDDFLLAHVLAVAAVAKGDASSQWIAAATLDRYLQNIKQSQIFGTQYFKVGDKPWTQEPYDRELMPDSLRKVLGVPILVEQQKKLDEVLNNPQASQAPRKN